MVIEDIRDLQPAAKLDDMQSIVHALRFIQKNPSEIPVRLIADTTYQIMIVSHITFAVNVEKGRVLLLKGEPENNINSDYRGVAKSLLRSIKEAIALYVKQTLLQQLLTLDQHDVAKHIKGRHGVQGVLQEHLSRDEINETYKTLKKMCGAPRFSIFSSTTECPPKSSQVICAVLKKWDVDKIRCGKNAEKILSEITKELSLPTPTQRPTQRSKTR